MRVLQLNTFTSGGAAIACRRLMQALEKTYPNAVDLRFLCKENNNQWPGAETTEGLKFSPEVRTKRALQARNFARRNKRVPGQELFSPSFSATPVQKHPAVAWADILHFHWMGRWLDYATFFKTVRKPIVWSLHDMNPFTGGLHYLSPTAAKATTLEQQYQGVPEAFASGKAGTAGYALKAKVLDAVPADQIHIIGLSGWMHQLAKESRLLGRFRQYAIPNPIDTAFFSPGEQAASRQQLKLPGQKKLVLFVAAAHFERRKGIDLFQAAAEQVARQTDAEFLAVGRPPEQKPETTAHIHWVGSLNTPEAMRAAYRAADVFAIPSRADNLPNTLMEALACGLPAVGYNVGGIPEMIQHGISGLLAPPEDAQSLGQAMATLLQNDEQRAAFSKAARKHVLANYAEEVVARQMMTLYRDILA